MSRTSPPSLLSFVGRSVSANDESSDDDRAFLLPSNSSSFNLTDDAEVINSSRRNGKKSRKSKRHQDQTKSYYLQHMSISTVGSKSRSNQPPIPDGDDFFNGYNSDQHAATGEISLASVPSKESISNTRSIDTVHSGRSYRCSQEDSPSVNRSNKSGKSIKRQLKCKRIEKRREWMKRHRKRRIVGAICLTVVYLLLFFYSLIITTGPLALHFWIDETDWCPYYNEYWEGDAHHDAYVLRFDETNIVRDDTIKAMNLDMLQRTSNDIHQHKQKDADENQSKPEILSKKYDNPDYNSHPCHIIRIPSLFYLTLEECDLSRRMVASIIFGGFIGYERRASDRPAGIRTMALVALGSCFFTLSSQLAFRDSPMTWDSSRVSAAIPSGVGFLGAGLIWKGSLSDGNGGEVHQVHGITTAASVWLAAAVGVGAGGAMYAVTAYSTALITIVLRFGPRLYFQNDRGFEDDDESKDEDMSIDDVNVALEKTVVNMELSSPKLELEHITQGYGATDAEIGVRSKTTTNVIEGNRSNNTNATRNFLCNENKLLSWLMRLIPSKGHNRPPNPYQEYVDDKDIKRFIMKRKSMKKSKSGVSFCT